MRLIEELSGMTYQIPNWLAEKNGIDSREMFLEDEGGNAFLIDFVYDERIDQSRKVWITK